MPRSSQSGCRQLREQTWSPYGCLERYKIIMRYRSPTHPGTSPKILKDSVDSLIRRGYTMKASSIVAGADSARCSGHCPEPHNGMAWEKAGTKDAERILPSSINHHFVSFFSDLSKLQNVCSHQSSQVIVCCLSTSSATTLHSAPTGPSLATVHR